MAFVAVLNGLGSVALAQETLEPQSGALLLRNGEVLEGRVSFEGDYCTIILKHGELRVRRDRVTAVEANIVEIYRKHIVPHTPAGPEGTLKRADWCLRNGLIGHAAGQITEAARHFPNEPRLAVLRARLAAARRPTKPKPNVVKDRGDERRPASTSLASQHHAASLNSKALETFTIAVQPLLLNRCATAGCHGKQSTSDFRLERGTVGRAMLRRTTLANLESTLRFVDRERPAASPLLTTPIRPHAKSKQAVFLASHRKQYDLLARWVEQLGPKSGSTPVAARPTGTTSKQPRGIDSSTKTLGRRLPELQDIRRGKLDPANATKPKPARSPTPLADPFDPEQFNRRFFKSKKPKDVAPAWQPKPGLQNGSG